MKMRKKIHKLFWAWEHEKEEEWLNGMSAKGMQLCGVGLCTYTFEEGPPSEYTYRLEMLDNWPGHTKSIEYIRFIEETGAQLVGFVKRWAYFRKKTSLGGFEIFSDIDSRIKHLNRVITLLLALGAISIVNTMNLFRIWDSKGPMPFTVILCFCAAMCLLLAYGFVKVYCKKRKLIKEKQVHE